MSTPQAAPARGEGRYRVGGLLLALAVLYLVGELVAAAGWQGRPYAWTSDAISALGVPEVQHWGGEARSTRYPLMNATFVLTGLRAVAAAVVLAPFAPRRSRPAVLVLAVLYGVGLVLVGLFPSGETPARQIGHGSGAILGLYVGTVLLIALTYGLSRAHPRVAVLTGCCALVAVVGCIGMPAVPGRFGLFERLAVDALILWQVVVGLLVLGSRPRADVTRDAAR